MEDGLILSRDQVEIDGGRRLYVYTFREATPQDRLHSMIEAGDIGVVGAYLDRHPDLDLTAALEVAERCGGEEAIAEIKLRMT